MPSLRAACVSFRAPDGCARVVSLTITSFSNTKVTRSSHSPPPLLRFASSSYPSHRNDDSLVATRSPTNLYFFSIVSLAMLQAASSDRPGAVPASLWVPGMTPSPSPGLEAGGGSARAQEIARRREELLGMLHDLPESDYELSLTDLVEKASAAGNGSAATSPPEGKEASPIQAGAGRSASGRQAEQPPAAAAGRAERRGSARRWDCGGSGGSSFRSSSDGVLLNFYMPRSLTRSFTAPRTGRPPSVSGGSRAASVTSNDCNKRERDGETVKCWSLLWDRRWRKSSRRDPNLPPGESTIRAASAAILKAASHSDVHAAAAKKAVLKAASLKSDPAAAAKI